MSVVIYRQPPDLYHYGVLGMKWGVIRRKASSTPEAIRDKVTSTPTVKKARESHSEKQKTQEAKRVQKYKDQGYNAKQAKILSDGERRTKKALLVAGGVVLTAAVVYGAYRYRDFSKDSLVKAGKLLQTVHVEDAAARLKPGNPFYATFKKADNVTYSSRVFSHFKPESQVTKFFTEDGIKIASHKSSKKVFTELYSKNPAFREYVGDSLAGDKTKVFSNKILSKKYLEFNHDLVFRGEAAGLNFDAGNKLFYDALKQKGYGGLVDLNDAVVEGFTRKPTIIFNDAVKHIVSTTKVTEKDLGAARLAKGAAYSIPREILTKPHKSLTVQASAAIGSTSLASHLLHLQEVTDYKMAHPGTKLTDKQILELVS